MKILESMEIAAVSGGGFDNLNGCYYGSNFYTGGAAISIGGGYYQTCVGSTTNGITTYSWSKPYQL